MRSRLSVLLALTFLAVGCRTTRAPAQEAALPPSVKGAEVLTGKSEAAGGGAGALARADVRVDGISILGAWRAVEVSGDARATRDLADGRVEESLVVGSNGRAFLARVDHGAGGASASASGRITGNRVRFDGAAGPGTLLMSGRRLLLRDADGRSTVFVRGE
jgi:hypothetical protein